MKYHLCEIDSVPETQALCERLFEGIHNAEQRENLLNDFDSRSVER